VYRVTATPECSVRAIENGQIDTRLIEGAVAVVNDKALPSLKRFPEPRPAQMRRGLANRTGARKNRPAAWRCAARGVKGVGTPGRGGSRSLASGALGPLAGGTAPDRNLDVQRPDSPCSAFAPSVNGGHLG